MTYDFWDYATSAVVGVIFLVTIPLMVLAPFVIPMLALAVEPKKQDKFVSVRLNSYDEDEDR